MKNKKGILQNCKQVVTLLFLLWISSFYHSCIDEVIEPSGGEINFGSEALLLININTPETSVPTALTRLQTPNEYLVSEVDVLVFNNQNNEYVFDYRVIGENLVPGSDVQTQFMATLVTSEDPIKLYVLVNASKTLEGDPITVGMTEAEVRKLLVMDFTSTGMTTDLPMFGEYEFTNGLSATLQQTVTVNVLRAIARVDVVLDLETGSGAFSLDEVYAFRANNLIQVIPDEAVITTAGGVNAPSVPENVALLAASVKNGNDAVSDSIGQLYLPESTGISDESEKLQGKTTIVIGGRFGGGDKVTYYRADFDSKLQGHPFGQILRNHRYLFKVKSVLSNGLDTPEEAATSMITSMIVETVTWENFSSEIILTGEERFGISGREISLRYVKNREKSLYVESSIDYTIQWIKNGQPDGNPTSSRDVEISNNDFSVKIVHDPGSADEMTRLVFRTLNHNHAGAAIITDTLRISVGGLWEMDIIVKQDNARKFYNRTVNVMSIGPVNIATGIGNFGVSAVNHDASAVAMRKLIEVQFSSGGLIPVGGSIFSRVSTENTQLTTASENLTEVQRIISAQDVIYFTYDVVVSTAVVNAVYNWLIASPKHVLMIATDSDDSNANLRNNTYISAIMPWVYTYTWSNPSADYYTPNARFKRAAISAGSNDFFNGPFGVLDSLATFTRSDDYIGFSTNVPNGVTPLIVASGSGLDHFMCVGVNKEKRIIYHGDANLFMMDAMSSNTGTVSATRPLDILNANMWAWVVEQVIYGDE